MCVLLAVKGLTQYGSITGAVVTTAHSPVASLGSVHQSNAPASSFVTPAGSEHYAPPAAAAHVLYAVGHRSPHEASSSPLAGDTASPRGGPGSQLSPAAGSPHWFAHSPSPPSPSHGELSPAHATALQQQFQQFSMASLRCSYPPAWTPALSE